jgi:hypothetical protein
MLTFAASGRFVDDGRKDTPFEPIKPPLAAPTANSGIDSE